MKRRNFIKSVAGAGAAGLLLPGMTYQNKGNKASGSKKAKLPLDGIKKENIKITDIKVRLFSTPVPYEKWWYGCGVEMVTEVYTDKGITGIGGPSPYGGPEAVKKYTEEVLKPALTGLNPFDIREMAAGGPKYKLPEASKRNFAEACSWAGVDVACWDIIGKALKQPVWKLLATDNKPNPHVEHYASAGTLYDFAKRPDDLIDEALRYKEEGFKSFKFRLAENFEKNMTIQKYIPFLRKLRDAVGPDFRLMQEGNMRLTLEQCLELAPILVELNFKWFEEPVNRRGYTQGKRGTPEGINEAIEGYKKIKEVAGGKLIVTGGETMQTVDEFRPWIERSAYDYVQPDCDTTGITEGWNIARLAHESGKICVPHNWHGGPTWMSNIQLVAGIPNRLILESNRHFNPFREGLFTEPIVVKNSFADAPSKPGLGVEIIPDAEKKFPYDPKNHWRNFAH